MSREKVGSRPVLDTTLLSTSAIGSPAAFSTAIKPPGSFSSHPSGGDASLLAHQPHELLRLSDKVAGQLSLSLSSEPPQTEGPVADETSLGILDLDNIHESSMSVFLTSPRTSHDLVGSHLPLSVSHGLTSVSQLPTTSPPPSMGPLRVSGPVGGSQLAEEGERGEGEEEVCLPEDLLEVSTSIGGSSDAEEEGEMQPGGGGETTEREMAVEPNGEVSSAPPVSVPDHARSTGDGNENELTRTLERELPQSPPAPLPADLRERGEGFSVAEILQTGQRRGAEDPDISDLIRHTTSPEGLPSLYLHQSSAHSSTSHTVSHTPSSVTPDSSPLFSPPPSQSQFPPARVGGESGQREGLYNPFDAEDTSGSGAAMEIGDEEFGAVLDSDSVEAHLRADGAALQEANQLWLPAGFAVSTPQTPSFTRLSSVPTSLPPTLTQSDGKELSIGEYFGQRSHKMGVLQTSDLLSSNERPQFSALSGALTPSSLPVSLTERGREPRDPAASPDAAGDTTLVATGDGGTGGGGGEGLNLSSQPAPPPHSHSLSSGGVRESGGNPTLAPSLPSLATTLTLPHPAVEQTTHIRVASTSSASSSVPGVGARQPPLVVWADHLTPVVTAHTPFPMQYQIPRLDLSGLSKTLDSSPLLPFSSTGPNLFPPPSASGLLSTSHTLPAVASINSPSSGLTAPPTTSDPTSGMEPGLRHSGLDSGLSSGMEQRLASQYWRPSSGASTLLFPELSATSLSPPPPEIRGLSSMPTPSLARLSAGFSTTSSRDASFLQSLLSSLPVSSSSGETLSLLDHSGKLRPLSQDSLSVSRAVEGGMSATVLKDSSTDPRPPGSTSSNTATAERKDAHKHSPPNRTLSSGKTPPESTGRSGKKKRSSPRSPPVSSSAALGQPLPKKTDSITSSSANQTSTAGASSTTVGGPEEAGRYYSLSPRTETARMKVSQLKVTLDATDFDAAAFLSGLKEERSTQPPLSGIADKTTTVVSQTATVVRETPTFADIPSTAVGQVSTTVSSSAPSSATATVSSSVSGSPSPPKPSTSRSPPASRAAQTSTASVSVSSSVLDQTPEKRDGEEVEGEGRERSVEVRDIGVGTTPSLHRAQTRSSSLSGQRLNRSSVDTAQLHSPPKAALSPSTSTQTHAPLSSPEPSSLTAFPKTEHSLSSQPIYTSPRLLPHTSLSPPPQPHPQPHPHTSLSPPPQPHPQPLVGRKMTPEPNSLRIPDSLCFKAPCCVGVTLPDHLQISNVGDRWLQLSFELSELYRNGTSETDLSVFSFPQRCFVSPRKTESVKFTFSPKQTGSYEAVLVCRAQLVVTSGKDGSSAIQENVVLKALAVPPLLKVTTSPSAECGETCLDYGLLAAGTSLSLPLHLANLGPSELPLRLGIAAPTLSQLYFSFDDLPLSLKAPPSSPSSHLHSRPFSATLVLPPKPLGREREPEAFPINLSFKSPKNFSDDAAPLGPPEEIKAEVNLSVEGPNSAGVLCSVPVRVRVGVARLHVPRSLQAVSLSCSEGETVTREVPFKNAGNVPLQIALEFSAHCDHFQVTPDFLEVSPGEETLIRVSFSPPDSPLLVDGCLMVLVQPRGPSYELKVKGTSSERAALEEKWENLLFCNKRCLYWGAVDVGATSEQKLLLQNSFSSPVPLQFSVRHRNKAFQLQTDSPSEEHSTDLPQQSQLQLTLLFSPPTTAVFRNALDIFDGLHSKKFRIPLCGYGGSSRVEVINARRSTSDGLWVDLGHVAVNEKSSVRISLYNSGSRAGFVKTLCLPVDKRGEELSPLPLSRASLAPSECVLQPQQMKELTLTYQPLSSEEVGRCLKKASPLARLLVVHGDEIARQRFRRAMAAGGERGEEGGRDRLNNKFNESFLGEFPGQDSVEAELELGLFEVESEEDFFEQHLRQIEVAISSSSPAQSKAPSLPLSTSFESPPKQLHSPPKTTPPSHAPVISTASRIISSLALVLPSTISGQRSEKMLDVHNPYSQPLHWKLSSMASPFLRDNTGSSGNICKANYSVFWVHERRGVVPPHSTAQVLVVFQPHDAGSFSQIWDLQVTCSEVENGSRKIRLSFGGEAVSKRAKSEKEPTLVPRVRFSSPPPPSPPSPVPHTVGTTSHPHTLTTRRAVYIKEERVEFPATEVRGQSLLKVKVCNKDKCQHQFQVVSLSPPFSVDHRSFLLGSRQCARLPIHFSPTRPGVFEAVLAVRTAAGHQAFSQLTGLATARDTH